VKRLSLIIGLLVIFAVQIPIARAGDWKPSETYQLSGPAPVLAVKLTSSSDASGDEDACLFPVNSSLQGFRNTIIPLSMSQMKLSLLNVSTDPGNRSGSFGHSSPLKLQLNTGLQTNHFSMPPSIGAPSEALGGGSDWNVATYILFFGVNLDLGPGFIHTRGYVSKPMGNNQFLPLSGPGVLDKLSIGTDAKGFNATAGYKFSDRITLKAGCGYIDQNDKKSGTSEEAWAIYAQAILSIAPGVQVIPGVGQIDFDNKDNASKNAKDNFFAGAKWQINF
jgi:hypothetical protein